MSVTKVNAIDLQFSPLDSDHQQAAKLRRVIEEMRKLQQVVNAIINQSSLVSAEAPSLSPGEWNTRIVPGSPPTFVVTYNDGGTIRTGSITLS